MTEGILEYLGVPDEIWEYSENGKFSSCEALIITEDSCKIYLKELLSYQAKLFQCGNYSQLGSIFDFLRKLPASELCGTSDGFKLRKGNVIYNQALVNLQLLEILVSFHKVDPLSNADSKVLSLMLCGFLSRLLFCSSDFWKFFSTVNQDYIACCERKYSLLEEAMLTEIFTLLAKLIDSQDFFLENNKLELQNNSFQLEWHPKTLECIFTRRVCTTRLHKEPQNIDTLTVPESSSMDVIPENHLESKDMSPFRHGTVTAWSQRATPNVDEVIITAPHDPLITSPSGRMHLLSPLAATITDKDSHSEWDEFAETGLCAEIAIPFSTALSNLSLPKLQEVSDNEPIATSVTFDIEAINKKFRRRT